MPCGCQKGRALPATPTQQAQRAPVTSARVAVYTVVKGGADVLTTSSPSAARSEAHRLGGSVRVSSRPVTSTDPVSA